MDMQTLRFDQLYYVPINLFPIVTLEFLDSGFTFYHKAGKFINSTGVSLILVGDPLVLYWAWRLFLKG